MTPQKKYIVLAAIAMVGMISALVAANRAEKAAPAAVSAGLALPTVSRITVKSSAADKILDISLPYRRDGVAGEILDYHFTVQYAQGQSTLFRIIPDDCLDVLEINGKPVTLTGDALAQKCNWRQGFKMDLKPYLQNGANSVHVVVRNIDGWVGLLFEPVRH